MITRRNTLLGLMALTAAGPALAEIEKHPDTPNWNGRDMPRSEYDLLKHLGDRLDIALDDPKLIPGIKSDLRNTHLRVTLPDNLFVEDHSKMTSKGLDVLTVIAEEFLPFTEKVRLGVTSHYKTVKAEYGLHIPEVAAKRRLRAFEAAFGKRIARGGKQDVFEYHGVPVADQAPRAYPYTSDENSRIILMFKAK